MKRVRQRVKELTPRGACHRDLRDMIAQLNPVLRGWGNYFRTGNAAVKFGQVDDYVAWRLQALARASARAATCARVRPRSGRRDYFHALGLHRLRGTDSLPGGCVMLHSE